MYGYALALCVQRSMVQCNRMSHTPLTACNKFCNWLRCLLLSSQIHRSLETARVQTHTLMRAQYIGQARIKTWNSLCSKYLHQAFCTHITGVVHMHGSLTQISRIESNGSRLICLERPRDHFNRHTFHFYSHIHVGIYKTLTFQMHFELRERVEKWTNGSSRSIAISNRSKICNVYKMFISIPPRLLLFHLQLCSIKRVKFSTYYIPLVVIKLCCCCCFCCSI